MLKRVGHNHLQSLLDYYEDIGWISLDVADRLLALAEKENQRFNGPTWTLSPEEHRVSMLFIEKLLGRQVDISPLSVSAVGRASPEPLNRTVDKPRESYLNAHSREKDDLESAVKRRDVTIKNLEQELEKSEIEIGKLKERIQELEEQFSECQMEVKKSRMYREILEENIRLKKASFPGRMGNIR